MGLMLLSTYESLLRKRTVQFFKNFTFSSHSRASFQSRNLLCMILLLKMTAVWASTGFGFWGIWKNPTVRFASKLNQCFLWSLRTHSWSLGVCFHFFSEKKSCQKVALLLFFWILMPKTELEAVIRLVDVEFGQQLTFFQFLVC